MKKPSTKVIVLGSIVLILIIARLVMPYFVTKRVNEVLAAIPGYTGSVKDVDIHLYRGAYELQDVKIFKQEGDKSIPFITIPSLDLSVEWSAIFDGVFVGEVRLDSATLNFIGGSKHPQAGYEVDWTTPIKQLMPLAINRISVDNGKVSFLDLATDPVVKLQLTGINASFENLANTTDNTSLLPSTAYLTATTTGDGLLGVKMKMNVLKASPDLNLDLKLEKVKLAALNDFFLAYGNTGVEQGVFDLFAEIALLDRKTEGYVKPIVTGLKFVDFKRQDPADSLQVQSLVQFLNSYFADNSKEQFATRVPIIGTIENEKTTWPALWNVFTEAFYKGFEKSTDGTIKIRVLTDKDGVKPKTKKELRKERKERRKAERERKRKAKD